MYRYGRVGHILFESHGRCVYVESIDIESGVGLQTAYDRLLNPVLGPNSRSARQQEGQRETAAQGT